jgi:hypothetical protein
VLSVVLEVPSNQVGPAFIRLEYKQLDEVTHASRVHAAQPEVRGEFQGQIDCLFQLIFGLQTNVLNMLAVAYNQILTNDPGGFYLRKSVLNGVNAVEYCL